MLVARVTRACTAVVGLGLLLVGGTLPAQASPQVVSEQDRTFARAAHQSNLAEIATGRLAQSKGRSQQVKELGAKLVTDHTRLDAALRPVASAAGIELPSRPNAEQRALQAQLEQASADEFDALFVAGQLKAHAKAMAIGEQEIKAGSDPAVKKTAAAAAPVIAAHHHQAMDIAQALGLPTDVSTGLAGPAGPGNGLQAGLVGFGGLLVAAGAVLTFRRRRSAQ